MDDLVQRARSLIEPRGRPVLGIVGAPGAGKSTFAAGLVERLLGDGVRAALVPMDGFHLPQAELVRRGLRDVMGRIDTFDADGYLALLRRLRDEPDQTITAPAFDRRAEEPEPDAIQIGPEVELVVTEGNYLLDEQPPWPDVRATLAEVWFVQTGEETRLRRLHTRHVEFGKTADEASQWMERVDAPNARRILTARDRADELVDF